MEYIRILARKIGSTKPKIKQTTSLTTTMVGININNVNKKNHSKENKIT